MGRIQSIVLAARGVRALADGFVSLTLPLYLLALGYAPIQVGLISTATLLGSAALSLAAGRYATRIGYRHALLGTSYVIAAPLARRYGLINTMVFTHIPSSVALIAVPLVGDVNIAVALLLVRGALSQMDVPTRSSYVMAVVGSAASARCNDTYLMPGASFVLRLRGAASTANANSRR